MTLVYRPSPLKYPDEFLRPRFSKTHFHDPDAGAPAGTDVFGAWVDDSGTEVAGVDGTGAWIEDSSDSIYAGVDGTGPWVIDS